MNREDILTLAKAGFTAAQIAAISTATSQPAPEAPVPPAPEPVKPEPEPVKPAEQVLKPAPSEDAILKQLGLLTDAIQANGILNSQQPAQPSVDDILASIIAPPAKGE